MPIAWLAVHLDEHRQTLQPVPVFSYLGHRLLRRLALLDKILTTALCYSLMSVWSVGNMTSSSGRAAGRSRPGLYEAARVGRRQAPEDLPHVTLPMISPMVFYNLHP